MELTKTALPKSKGGRKATPLDSELLDALVKALKTTPLDGDRPAAYGPAQDFDTEGKAGGSARRYATAVSEALKIKVRVNVYPTKTNEDGSATEDSKYRWRIYVPLKAQA